MKKLLTLLCLLAVCGEFGYLLLKDHPHWPAVVWTPSLWIPPAGEVAAEAAESVPAGVFTPAVPADVDPESQSSLANTEVSAFTPPAELSSPLEDSGPLVVPAQVEDESILSVPAESELFDVTDAPPAQSSAADTNLWVDQLFEPAVSSVSGATAKQESELASIDRAFASLVRVVQLDAGSEESSGRRGEPNGQMGFGVIMSVHSKGFRVLTAAHVVSSPIDLNVELLQSFDKPADVPEAGPRRFRSVEVIGQDTGRDLALLQVHWPLAEPERMAHSGLHSDVKRDWTDANVWLANLGEQDGAERVIANVIDQKRARREIDGPPVEYLILDQISVPGMSGGGLFSGSGELIGIISGNGGGRLHSIASSEIQRFLSDIESD